MIQDFKFVKTKIANLYIEPNFKTQLVTQAIKNEKLLILDKRNDWFKVRQWDNYESWIHSFYLKSTSDKNDIKSKNYKFSEKNLINIADTFLNAPYLWGGKTKYGIDCSGLVQTLYKQFGLLLPRDSHQQINYPKFDKINLKDIRIGDLLFFSKDKIINHVAIYYGNGQIIHSSGYVKIELLVNNLKLSDSLSEVKSVRKIFYE